jgi:hypothetical protein
LSRTVFSKLSNRKFLFSRQRWVVSLLTLVAGVAAMLLTTVYTGLITPTNVITRAATTGVELDFTRPEFWSWVRLLSNLDKARKVYGAILLTIIGLPSIIVLLIKSIIVNGQNTSQKLALPCSAHVRCISIPNRSCQQA